jgi:hypothetical protein
MSCANVNSGPTNPSYVQFTDTAYDAFGRLRVSEPYTLFDSQNRYFADNQFDTSTATGGSTTFLSNEATVRMDVTTSSGSEVVRQTYRSFPYQPGKSLLTLETFTMNAAKTNLRQRVGFFNTQNGLFFQQNNSTLSFVLRSNSLPTPGTPSDIRTVNQANWNGDKLDGTGPSGITLDVTKTQILFFDFEWLGVGRIRCGFFQDGQFVVCHTFDNENAQISVYMTTAILPLRYEITNTGATASSSSMKQICSTVISEGGYQQSSIDHVARRTTALGSVGSTLLPLVSIRLASTALGAVVLPNAVKVIPTSADNFEIQLVKNATLTGASYSAVASDANIEFDVSSTAMSGGTICQIDYAASSNQGTSPLNPISAFNWDYQLGASLAGVSDVYTIGVRTFSGSGSIIGSLTFYDLTQ